MFSVASSSWKFSIAWSNAGANVVINEHELKTDTVSKVYGEMFLLILTVVSNTLSCWFFGGKQVVLDVASIPRTLLALLNPH